MRRRTPTDNKNPLIDRGFFMLGYGSRLATLCWVALFVSQLANLVSLLGLSRNGRTCIDFLFLYCSSYISLVLLLQNSCPTYPRVGGVDKRLKADKARRQNQINKSHGLPLVGCALCWEAWHVLQTNSCPSTFVLPMPPHAGHFGGGRFLTRISIFYLTYELSKEPPNGLPYPRWGEDKV